jgi:hypothetical protein
MLLCVVTCYSVLRYGDLMTERSAGRTVTLIDIADSINRLQSHFLNRPSYLQSLIPPKNAPFTIGPSFW